jgi:hypothetical protein
LNGFKQVFERSLFLSFSFSENSDVPFIFKPMENHFHFTETEQAVFTPLQQEMFFNKMHHTYVELIRMYNLSGPHQCQSILHRTLFGCRFELGRTSGPIPYISDVLLPEVTKKFSETALNRHPITLAEAIDFLHEERLRQLERAIEMAKFAHCVYILEQLDDRQHELSYRWLHEFAEKNHFLIKSPEPLEELRHRCCQSNAALAFFNTIESIIPTDGHLIFNFDEFSTKYDHYEPTIVPANQCAVAALPPCGKHITGIFCFNQAGFSTKPLFILPHRRCLTKCLEAYFSQSYFAYQNSGWMSSKIFYIFCVIFAHEISKYRIELSEDMRFREIVLFCDGHGSRRNSKAIEYLKAFNIRLIIFPAHMTHCIQPFDVVLAAPLRHALCRHMKNVIQKKQFPREWKHSWKLINANIEATLNAWYEVSSISNCESAFEATGLFPFSPQRLLASKYM